MARITLQGLTKRFSRVTVLDRLTLTIHDGEFFTFVGPSGCGKSTLLHILAGLEATDEGSVLFDDRRIDSLSPTKRDVAMVFQSYALYPHMTVRDNLAFPLRMRKISRERMDRDVMETAELLGLSRLLKRKPGQLSGGQRQRVALGRAIIRRPRVFLMDEPLSNLDAKLRIEMRTELKRLHQKLNITTVYVTHDQAEALSLSDRIAVLHDGGIRQCGTPMELYTRPGDLFVAEFIGSPPVNILTGQVTRFDPAEIMIHETHFSSDLTLSGESGSVSLAVRPEEVEISDTKTDESISVTARVSESAGPHQWVDVQWGNFSVKGAAPLSLSIEPGQPVFMKFSLRKALLFDTETKQLLGPLKR